MFTAGKWRKTGQPFVVKVVEELSFDGKVHLIKTNTVEGSVLLFRIDRAFHYIFILTRIDEFANLKIEDIPRYINKPYDNEYLLVCKGNVFDTKPEHTTCFNTLETDNHVNIMFFLSMPMKHVNYIFKNNQKQISQI